MTIGTVLIVVPARDEEELLPACLASLQDAVAVLCEQMPGIDVRAVVVLDRSTDGSEAIARHSPEARGWEVLTGSYGSSGAARAAGVSLLTASLPRSVDPTQVWLATTDADSRVPQQWLVQQLRAAARGAAVWTGTVEPDPGDLSPQDLADWHDAHRLRDEHPNIYGANLGCRVSDYRLAGGFRDVAGEDQDLVERVVAAGGSRVARDSARVVTSGRLHGRAPGGFASYLARTIRHPRPR